MNNRPLTRAAGRVVLAALLATAVAVGISSPTTEAGDPPTSATRPAGKVRLLYIDGYPRWDYRYISQAMIRDKGIDVSCLLTSADRGAVQPADPADPKADFPGPIDEFPRTMEELLRYDVILFGDIDPRQFTDRQLQRIAAFVRDHGGGFVMAAGPRHSPHAYRGTPIEQLLPVKLAPAADETGPKKDPAAGTDGFRPILTDAGAASPLFRALVDPAGGRFNGGAVLRDDVQPFFWYSRNVSAADGATVLATHPTAAGPDGKPAPLLVVGKRDKGHTAFAAVDDTWRWRFNDKAAAFETYWGELIRSLAAGRVADKAATRPAE